MKKSLLAVDPGKHHAGAALFIDRSLVACTLVQASAPHLVAEGVYTWFVDQAVGNPGVDMEVAVLVVEGQQVYRQSRADPNDLLPLAECAGGVKASVLASQVLAPLPREWKGSAPKEVCTRRILGKLRSPEVAVLDRCGSPQSLLHNVVDAVGLGLWALGRFRGSAPEGEGVL